MFVLLQGQRYINTDNQYWVYTGWQEPTSGDQLKLSNHQYSNQHPHQWKRKYTRIYYSACVCRYLSVPCIYEKTIVLQFNCAQLLRQYIKVQLWDFYTVIHIDLLKCWVIKGLSLFTSGRKFVWSKLRLLQKPGFLICPICYTQYIVLYIIHNLIVEWWWTTNRRRWLRWLSRGLNGW